jgi:hypothetical protein
VLPSLRISPLFRIATIALFYTAVIAFYAVYIQSIGSGIDIFSGLFLSFSVPVVPGEDIEGAPKPTRGLGALNWSKAFSLSADLKGILVGLFLGDLYVQKLKPQWNPTLKFKQGIVNEQYLMHLYGLFQSYCPSAPKVYISAPNKITGKVNSYMAFHSYSLPCFGKK